MTKFEQFTIRKTLFKILTEVRVFWGLASYYRHFIRSFTKSAAPISEFITKKNENALWTIAAETAVVELKNAVITVSISKLLDPK